MKVLIQYDDSDLRGWLANERHRERAIKQMLLGLGVDATQEFEREAETVSVTSTLINSIRPRYSFGSMEVSAVDYAEAALETGYKGPVKNMRALKRWARLKLGNEGLAYPIARKIAQVGTKRYRKKGPKQLTRARTRIMRNRVQKRITKVLEEFVA